MKKLLVLLLPACSSAAFSQTYKWYQPELTIRKDGTSSFLIRDLRPAFRTWYCSLKTGGVSFSCRRMACTVLPTATTGLICNFWQPQYRGSIGFIPNPAEPFKLEKLLQKNRINSLLHFHAR